MYYIHNYNASQNEIVVFYDSIYYICSHCKIDFGNACDMVEQYPETGFHIIKINIYLHAVIQFCLLNGTESHDCKNYLQLSI